MRRLGLVLAVLSVLAVGFLVARRLLDDGGGQRALSAAATKERSPRQTVEIYIQGLLEGKPDQVCNVLTRRARQAIITAQAAQGFDDPDEDCRPAIARSIDAINQFSVFRDGFAGARLGEAHVRGGKATVSVRVSVELQGQRQSSTAPIGLRRESGGWRLDDPSALSTLK